MYALCNVFDKQVKIVMKGHSIVDINTDWNHKVTFVIIKSAYEVSLAKSYPLEALKFEIMDLDSFCCKLVDFSQFINLVYNSQLLGMVSTRLLIEVPCWGRMISVFYKCLSLDTVKYSRTDRTDAFQSLISVCNNPVGIKYRLNKQGIMYITHPLTKELRVKCNVSKTEFDGRFAKALLLTGGDI